MALYLELILVFIRIGFSSFGGLSMIPVINQEMLSHGWMTAEEVTDIVAMAEMTPGPLGVNCATFVGMRTGGVLGALCATFGVLVPSLTLTLAAAIFIEKVKGNPIMGRIMYGVRPVCVGMVLYVLYTLSCSNFFPDGAISLPAILIAIVIALLSWKCKLSIPLLIIIAGVLGLLFPV